MMLKRLSFARMCWFVILMTFVLGPSVVGQGSPSLSPDQSSITFPNLQPGLEATRTLQLTNLVVAGNPSINITGVSIVGPDSNAFRHNLTPQTLASGASVNVTVTHQPMTLGPKNATMVITHSGANSPLEVALEGNGVTGPRPAVKVNFQTPTIVPPTGYARDFGEAYGPRTGPHQGSGLTYGWVVPGTNTPRDLSVGGTTPGNGRRRFIDSDLRLDTLFFMQYVGSNGTQLPGSWEIALPNGTYLVTLAAGDPQVNSGTIGVSVEGVPMVSPPFTQTTTDRMRLVVQSITVNDGRLTVAATGTNTRIQYIEIEPMGAGQPFITGTNPVNNASDVSLNTGIAAFVSLPNVGMGVNAATLSGSTVILRETISGTPVLATYGTSGGLDVITVQPVDNLLPNTSYTLQITSGVQDMSGASFLPYTMTFTTGAIAGNTPLTGVVFEKLPSGAPQGNLYTSLTMGPDGRLYAASLMGTIYSWAINSDGTLADMRTINNLAGRALIGIAFSPTSTASNMELWVTHNFPALNAAPHFSGSIAALTSTNGTSWNAITYVEGLPRAVRDHMTNSLAFGPDGAMYITQGSISAMGARDNAWGFEPETILSAAILRIDPVRLKSYYAANGVLNVRTGVPEPSGDLLDSQNAQLGDSRLSSTNTDLSATRFYNPQLPNAPLTIYATGLRNAYDLVWHSNGQLYVPTNGSAGGGNTPATPSTLPVSCQHRIDHGTFGPFTGPAVPSSNPPNQPDYLFRVVQNGYYGHPNPVRCEWAFFGGNPTAGPDPGQTGNHYPVGVLPDRNYRGFAYDMGMNASANGVIEYRSSTFGGLLQGRLMVTRYSLFNDIVVLQPGGGSGDIVNASIGTPGFTDFVDPLDITEHVGPGNLYVSDLADGGKIILVRPLGADIPRIEVAPNMLYFWDAIGGSPSEAQTITIRNTGTGILNLTNITVNGPFQVVGTAPTSVPPFSSATLQIAYQATASDTQLGSVLIASNAQNVTTPVSVNLRGAGISGTGANTEPSLQRILTTYNIPVNVGDDAINTTVIHSDTVQQRAALLGDEISAQTFRRFEDGNVDLEILAVFGPNSSGTIPVASVGWYLAGNRTSTTQLFQINNGSHRTFKPSINGVLSFDPGTNEFGLYSNWPFFGTRNIHTEDGLNTHTNSIPHHVRVYQLKDSSGAIVPHAYVVATEEHIAGFDYNDLVMIVRNVIPGQTDVTPPLVDVVVSGSQQTPGNYINQATVTVNATDLSGISLVEYSLDGAPFQTYNGPVTVTGVGPHSFIARATDNAGLTSTSSISNFNIVAIATSGRVRFENRDWVTLMGLTGIPSELNYLNTWLVFSNLRSTIVQRQSHTTVTLRIHNDGATPLQILDLVLSDAARWSLPDITTGTLPITVAPASFYDLRVRFIEDGPSKGVFSGTLQVLTTDPTNPSQIVQLRGSYQALTGGSNENAYIDLIRAFGITTTIPSAMGSEYRAQGDEVLSFTWRRAAGQPVVYARQIAAYHGCPEAVTFSIDGTGGGTMTHSTQNCHTVMPKTTNGGTIPVEMVITPAAASNFAISAAGYSTTACQANPTTCTRHGMRLWPIYNPDGLLVPNLYLAIQDYVGSGCGAGSANCDYQDNMYLVYGIQPSNATPNLTIDKFGTSTESLINTDFTYTIRVRNASIFPTPATVTDILPAGLTYVSSSTTLGTCSFAGSTLTCNLGTMVGEQEATITLTVRGTTVGYVDNSATVTSGTFTLSDTERTLFFDAANPPGRITITKNAQPDSIATFNFTGSLGNFNLVDDGIHNGVAFSTSVNFGPNTTPPPGFALADRGLGYTSARGYGWVTETTRNLNIPTPQSIAGTGRDRLQPGVSPEQNTLLIMNYPTGTPPSVSWRYDLPNGRYRVTVSVGDATSGNSNTVYTVNANGTNIINGYIPTGNAGAVTRFKVASAIVEVTNGRLILDAIGGQNVKPNYVRIEALDTITPTRTFPSLVAGSYTINEVVPIGWRLDNATCSGGAFTNTANGVTVNLASGQNVTCTFNNSRITGPSLDVEVTPPSQRVPSGYDAPFTVRIVNNGTVILNNVTVSSPAVPNCARVLPDPIQPGDVVNFTCSASAVTAPLSNVVSVTATSSSGNASRSATATVALANPALTITKTPDTQLIFAGENANFTITVTNTGDVELADVTVSDPLVPSCNNTLGTLAIGQTEIYSCTLSNVSASFTNTATVTGRLDAVTISESDTALVAVNGVTYGTALYRVNAGGPLVAATDGGPDWSRDEVGVGNRSPYLAHLAPAYSGSQDRSTDNGTGTIPNTTGAPLGVFRYERWDPTGAPTGTPAGTPDMRYSFPVAAGLYEVRLYFAERNAATQVVGGRVFDVLIENNLVLDDFDIYVAAVAQYGTPGGTGLNGGNGAIMRRFIVPITGTGQSIDVDFRRVVENPSIRGLEVVPLTITPPSVLGATPTTVNFGSGQISMNSLPSMVDLAHLGDASSAPITITSISLSGPNASEFSITSGALPLTVNGGQTLDDAISVTFGPSTLGPKQAQIDITHTGSNTPLVVALRGTGIPLILPDLIADPTSLTFSVVEGSATTPETVALSASEGSPTYTIDPTSVPSWLNATPLIGTIPTGGSVTLTLTPNISGLALGTYTANLLITAPGYDPLILPVTLNVSPLLHPVQTTAGTGATISLTGGTIDAATGIALIANNTTPTFTFTTNLGYGIDDVLLNGVSIGAVTSTTLPPVTAPQTLEVRTRPLPTYTITVVPSFGGTVTPAGPLTVNEGATPQFVFTPDTGYMVDELIVNGVAMPISGPTYTFAPVTSDQTLEVLFDLLIPSRINVVADSVPNDAGVFNFTLRDTLSFNEVFNLVDNGGVNNRAFDNIQRGLYTLTGVIPLNRNLELTCAGGATTIDSATGSVLIDLAPGDDVTCTYRAVSPPNCNPYSDQACNTIPVVIAPQMCLRFDAPVGGLSGTGFTMVDRPSNTTRYGTPSIPAMPGYEPSRISLSGGQLRLTATQGLLHQTITQSDRNNTQVNALGVGFDATAPFFLRVELVNPTMLATNNSEQAGLWFGLDEDNYVKLVVTNATGDGNAVVELRREIGGATTGATADVRLASVANANISTFNLELAFNPVSNQVTGRFTSTNGESGTLGPLTIPASFFAGRLLPDGATGPVSFGGVFSSTRFNATPITFAFDNFCVERDTNNLPVGTADSIRVARGTATSTLVGGATSVLANDSDADGDPLTAVLATGPANGTLTLNADGTFVYTHNNSATTSDSFTYRVSDGKGQSAPVTVTIEIFTVCTPYTNQTCDTIPVVVAPQMCLRFDAPVGGLSGTGFTMVDRPSSNRYPATPSIPAMPGYEPSRISLSGGRLTIDALRGLFHQTQAQNIANNTQVNALGVGIAMTQPFTVSAQIINSVMPDASQSEQGGLWFGLDEDNYVKLALVNRAGTNNGLIELRREIGGVTGSASPASPDARQTNVINIHASTITLEMAFAPKDATTWTVTGRFTQTGMTTFSGTLGPLDVPISFINGRLLPDGVTGLVSFAGLFTSTRFNTALPNMPLNFDNFCVTISNNSPVAVDDAITVDEGGTVSVLVGGASSVLANDTDAEGATLTAVLVTGPVNGTLTLNSDGTFVYTHNGSETSSDSFTYRASDGTLESNLATVTITINAVNDAPVAVNDAIVVAEGGTVSVLVGGATSVLANDTDAEGATLSAILVTPPAHGTLTLNSDGTFSYTHDGDETTSDSFTYRASDGALNSNIATVTITINAVNDAPVAVNDAIMVAEGGTVSVLVGGATSVLANDSDPDNAVLTAVLVTGPVNGTFTLNSDGTFSYTHNGSDTTSDSFTYKANDGQADSNAVTVTITIALNNKAPIAVNDAITVAEGGTTTVLVGGATSILANDSDPEGSAISLVMSLVTQPAHGTLTLNADGTFSYTHDGDETTSDSFTYVISDGELNSLPATVTITITPVNDAPVAVADAIVVNQNASTSTLVGGASSVLANDTDPENNPLNAILVTGPTHGTLTLNANGTFSYTHDGSNNLSDSFTYKASDVLSESAPVTVTITIIPVNRPPVGVADAYTVRRGATLIVTAADGMLANDSDPDLNDPISVALIADLPAHGSLSWSADGGFTYVHNGSDTSSDSFSYVLQDSDPTTLNVTVRVDIIITANNPPQAVDDAFSVANGQTMTSPTSVLANDTDAENDPLTAALVASPTNGTLTFNADGTFVYEHNGSSTTTDSFTYRANDGISNSSIATVTITITGQATRPTASDDSATALAGQTTMIDVLANDTYRGTPTVTIIMPPTQGTASVSGTQISYAAPATFTSSLVTFTYTVTDVSGLASESATVSIILRVNGPSLIVIVTPPPGPIIVPQSSPNPPSGQSASPQAPTTFVAPISLRIVNNGSVDLMGLTMTSINTATPPLDNTACQMTTPFDLLVGDDMTFTCTDDVSALSASYDRIFEFLDGSGIVIAQAQTTVVILPNYRPQAVDDVATVGVGQTIRINVLVNDTDPDNDIVPTTLSVFTAPAAGSAVVGSSNRIAFTAPATVGEVTFVYSICDAFNQCALATVRVNVVEAAQPIDDADDEGGEEPQDSTNDTGQQPLIDIFDPSISKIGLLLPGQLGVNGERLEWVITVRNPGTVTGTNVVVTDTLRSELRIDSVRTSKGTSSVSGQTVTFTIPEILPGETVLMSIFTTVLQGGVEISNTATINADNLPAAKSVTSAGVVGVLPQTGESPWGAVRDGLASLALILVGGAALAVTRRRVARGPARR